MQYPLNSNHVKEGGDPEITYKKTTTRLHPYACSICGVSPKKGHVCTKTRKEREAKQEAVENLLALPIVLNLPPLTHQYSSTLPIPLPSSSS